MTATIPILMYHQIDQTPPAGTPMRGLVVHPARFRAHMKWMHRLGYRGLSMRDLMPYLRGERLGKVFGVTFDDGYRNVLANAMPVLDELGFTATTYFVSGQIGGSNVWDEPIGIPRAELMDADEIRQWHAAGHEVGAHTVDHVQLPRMQPAEAFRQIAQCRRMLQDITGAEVSAFCYPYGKQQPEHRRMVQEAGYANATSTIRGRARPGDDMFCLPRVLVSRRTHVLQLLSKCLTGYEDRRGRDRRK